MQKYQSNNINIAIASDHVGYQLKSYIIHKLSSSNLKFLDYGCNQESSVDYPDYAYEVVKNLIKSKVQFGILICGTGIGMSIASNRYSDIRAALCHNVDLARLAREHNDANIICLGANLLTSNEAIDILHVFLNSEFTKGRHIKRLKKLTLYGEKS